MLAMTKSPPPELARRVLREQVAAVHANAPAAYLADMLTAQALGIGLFVATWRWQVLLWMALHLALTLRRAYRRYRRSPDAAEHPEYWRASMRATCCCAPASGASRPGCACRRGATSGSGSWSS